MLRDSLSLAWKLGLGALTLAAGLGAAENNAQFDTAPIHYIMAR